MRLLPYGPQAVMAEYDSLDHVLAVHAALRARCPDGVVDMIPAERTLVVTFRDGSDRAAITEALQPRPRPAMATIGATIDVPVHYDGADLAAVARACGLTPDDVVRLHSDARYTAAFNGFTVGFTYLVGLDPRLQLPRRPTPRPLVPQGSVAMATHYSAVYPSAGPGGWHLLGRTEIDFVNDGVPLLSPGDLVRFVPQ